MKQIDSLAEKDSFAATLESAETSLTHPSLGLPYNRGYAGKRV